MDRLDRGDCLTGRCSIQPSSSTFNFRKLGHSMLLACLRYGSSQREPERVVVVLQCIQKLYPAKLSRIVGAERHYRETRDDDLLEADFEPDHFLRRYKQAKPPHVGEEAERPDPLFLGSCHHNLEEVDLLCRGFLVLRHVQPPRLDVRVQRSAPFLYGFQDLSL